MSDLPEVEVRDNRADRQQEIPEYHPYKPIMDRIIVLPIVENEAPDGFVVPEMYRQQTNCGLVIAIGDFTMLGGQQFPISTFVNVGDKIYYGQYNAEKFPLNNHDYEVIRLADVRMVAKKKVIHA
jgi:co-chaperonin GroES (HSP10)